MPLKIYRLRRLLAATAVLLTLVVAGMYFYARSRATNVLKSLPGKIGYDIKQTASGFQFSKSDGNRTLFTVQASDVKEFKWNRNAELHNVNIVLYGRDSSRFDRIYGDDFAYNQKTGDVTAKGDVQIDLVANPAGLGSPDQSAPKELKNPIHLKTRDLVFNKDTGNAVTEARVEFSTPQASGWAVGVKYAGKSNVLTLSSYVHVTLSGADGAVIEADRGVITNDPREIVLEHPRLSRDDGKLQADRATFYLGHENHVKRVLAVGNVTTQTIVARAPVAARTGKQANSQEPTEMRGRADEAEFLLTAKQDRLRTTTLKGNVHLDQTGAEPMQGEAGRVILDFAGENKLQRVHAVDGARLTQRAASENKASGNAIAAGAQDFEITAPVIDFNIEQGHILRHASTSGAASITIAQAQQPRPAANQPPSLQKTVATAGKFDAEFAASEGRNHLASVHGAPDARIVSSTPGQPDRVSSSDSIDAAFLPQGGIESITQKGHVAYSDTQASDKRMQAWANLARYNPADQMLVLTGNPRVTNGGMQTTANTIRINRTNGDALAEGEVKSTYSQLKEQPDGALLASSSPIHVTSQNMTAHNSPGVAVYTGSVRLWQDANVIEAPSIQFDRDQRFVIAQGTSAQSVQTILVQREKSGAEASPDTGKGAKKSAQPARSSSISITATKLTYADSERRAHYEGGVVAHGAEFTTAAKTADAYLAAHGQTSGNQGFAGPGQLDRMVAEGDVIVQQPKRRAEGQRLVYTAAEDKFVLTGGPPSIFDAEQGKITGVSLTFFRRDDRVLVEGGASTPVVTQTRVAR
jgi:lipopolysaccharide export system protein LptA